MHIINERTLRSSGTGYDDIKNQSNTLRAICEMSVSTQSLFQPQPVSLTLVTTQDGNCVS